MRFVPNAWIQSYDDLDINAHIPLETERTKIYLSFLLDTRFGVEALMFICLFSMVCWNTQLTFMGLAAFEFCPRSHKVLTHLTIFFLYTIYIYVQRLTPFVPAYQSANSISNVCSETFAISSIVRSYPL